MTTRRIEVILRTLLVVAVFTVLTFTIAAQDVRIALVESVFVSVGGAASQGTITMAGSLGLPFETVPVSNGDIRVLPGLSFGATTGPVGDFDGDGTTGFSDFLVFAAAFGSAQGDPIFRPDADLDGNGDVGFSDFLIFAAAFGI